MSPTQPQPFLIARAHSKNLAVNANFGALLSSETSIQLREVRLGLDSNYNDVATFAAGFDVGVRFDKIG